MGRADSRIKGIRLVDEVADFYDEINARVLLVDLYEKVKSGKVRIKDDCLVVNTNVWSVNTSELKERIKVLEEENRTLEQTVEFLKAGEGANTISDKAMECAKEVNSILAFYGVDEDIFWSDLLDKVTNGDMSSGKLELDGGLLYSASRSEEVAPILANLEKLCFDRGVNTEEAYGKVLSVGAKITYKDIQGASIG